MNQFPRDANQRRQTQHRHPATRRRRHAVGPWPMRASMDEAIDRTESYLETRQADDGHWVGAVEGDLLPACEYLLLQDLLGHNVSNSPVADALVASQLPEGGWASAAGGPFDLDLSVTAYMALKTAGLESSDPITDRARTAVLAHGGADQAGALTRWRMAALGHVGFDKCFSLPIESLLLPKWVPGNPYSWGGAARPVLVAIAMLSAQWPTRILIPQRRIDELFSQSPEKWIPHSLLKSGPSWLPDLIAQNGQALARTYQRHPVSPLRKRALEKGERYLLEHIPNQPGWSRVAAWPFWYTLALMSRGHCQQSDAVGCCLDELNWLQDRRTDCQQSSPPARNVVDPTLPNRTLPNRIAVTPVRDTAVSIRALTMAGRRGRETTARQAINWLLARESSEPGDWCQTVNVDAGGWSVTYRDCLFPDTDTTSEVLLALREQFASRPPETVVADDSMVAMIRANSLDLARHQVAMLDRVAAASRRARRWLLAMQNRDGGWARLDKDHYSRWLSSAHIADELPTSDPSCSEVTGRVLESLGRWEMRRGRSAVDRGVAMLRRSQLPAGHWLTCRQDASLRATSQVLIGFAAVGMSAEDPSVVAATNWLIDQQLDSGAWGASPAIPSPINRFSLEKKRSVSLGTESQPPVPSVMLTAWALLGLQIAGASRRAVVQRGIEFLLDAQQEDGTWVDLEYRADDGTGKARVRRELDSICFPLMALGYWVSR